MNAKPESKKPRATSSQNMRTPLLLLVAAAGVQALALLSLGYQAHQWGGSRVMETNGTPRFAYQEVGGKMVGVPIEAGSLLRIALALESLASSNPATLTTVWRPPQDDATTHAMGRRKRQ